MIRRISLITLLIASTAVAETSIITKQGQTVPVEVLSVTGRIATISRNNAKSTISLDQLTEASQVFVIEAAKVKGTYSAVPPLKAQVTVGTKNRQMERSYYRKTMEISPQVKLSAVSVMEPIPPLDATMLIIVQDTRAKFAQKVDRFQVHAANTVNVPAAADGKPREIEFEKSSVTYDSWRDSSNIGGYTYKYYIFALRDPETKKILDFQSNHPQLPAYLASHPEKKEELINLSVGKNFPSDFK